ncbi:hypothetical protein B5X24_HaOG205557 [Helicoverpa armigera]|nr:hypothetical protein B5X24_HaOG205557 [Helicoverpa armigera]
MLYCMKVGIGSPFQTRYQSYIKESLLSSFGVNMAILDIPCGFPRSRRSTSRHRRAVFHVIYVEIAFSKLSVGDERVIMGLTRVLYGN